MKLNKRSVALLVSWALLLVVAVGVTVAFIADKTPEMENTFQPSYVDCEVKKASDEANVYTVTNIGDTDAYVRVAVVVNWKNTTTGNIYAQAPQFEVSVKEGWLLGSDGYYYYTGMLAPRAVTSAFRITSDDTLEGYALSVEIVASAIQATPKAVEAWSNAVVAPSEGAALVAKS